MIRLHLAVFDATAEALFWTYALWMRAFLVVPTACLTLLVGAEEPVTEPVARPVKLRLLQGGRAA